MRKTAKQYYSIYAKLKDMPLLAAFKYLPEGNADRIYTINPPTVADGTKRRFNLYNFFDGVLTQFDLPNDSVASIRNIINTGLAELNEMYVEIRTRALSSAPFNVTASTSAPQPTPGETYKINVDYNFNAINIAGEGFVTTAIDLEQIAIPLTEMPEYTPNITISTGFYTDALTILNDMGQILNRHLSRASDIIQLYLNIPKVNEQFTDEDVTQYANTDTNTRTPNLTRKDKEMFNPIATQSERLRTASESAEMGTETNALAHTGNVTRTYKKSAGITAKAQADIIRYLPNLFMEAIEEIKTLFIEPETVYDMWTLGITDGDFVEQEQILVNDPTSRKINNNRRN